VLEVVYRRADPTAVEAGRDDPNQYLMVCFFLEAARPPGIDSALYQIEWEGPGQRSGWARGRLWELVGEGGGLEIPEGLAIVKDGTGDEMTTCAT